MCYTRIRFYTGKALLTVVMVTPSIVTLPPTSTALLSAPAPTVLVPFAHIGNPSNPSRNSERSRTRPSTITPCAPRTLRRAATRPPRTALRWPAGWEMTTIEAKGVRSAKCLSDGMLDGVVDGEDFGAKRTVKAGATSLGGGFEGAKGEGDIWARVYEV